jgi:hypothetical protein
MSSDEVKRNPGVMTVLFPGYCTIPRLRYGRPRGVRQTGPSPSARLFETAFIPRDDDQAMNERGGHNQTIFDGQRLAGSAKVGEEFCPAKTRGDFPRKADNFGHTLVELAFQSMTASSGGQ